mmetsp:Transcript_18847/g.36586  ORF Transcript_18847/g.36586 Transcript_18847/m.36586 type:complete len:219 (-) Transcript_18847:104-760(-)
MPTCPMIHHSEQPDVASSVACRLITHRCLMPDGGLRKQGFGSTWTEENAREQTHRYTSGSGAGLNSTFGNESIAMPFTTPISSLNTIMSCRDSCPRSMSSSRSRNTFCPPNVAWPTSASWHASRLTYRYTFDRRLISVMKNRIASLANGASQPRGMRVGTSPTNSGFCDARASAIATNHVNMQHNAILNDEQPHWRRGTPGLKRKRRSRQLTTSRNLS